MRILNGKLLAWLVGGFVLLALGTHLLHGMQVRRIARTFLRQADRAEKQGDTAAAVKYLHQYLMHAPGDADALARYGLALHKMARTRPARRHVLKVLERALRGQPERHDVRRVLVQVAMQLGQVEDGRAHLEILCKTFPADAELAHLLGQCHASVSHWRQASECFARAVKLDPKRWQSYVQLARILRQRLEDPKQADAVMDRMLRANGRSVAAHLARGRYRLSAAGYGGPNSATPDVEDPRALTEAGKDVATALRLDPDSVEALATAAELAVLRARASPADPKPRFDEARKHLRRAAVLQPRNPRLHLALADLELLAARPDHAVRCLRRACEILPARSRERAELRWRLADLLVQGGSKAGMHEARETLERLRQERFSPIHLGYLDAHLLAAAGRWREAARSLERLRPRLQRSAETASLSRPADLLLGCCYEQLGDADRQYDAFSRAAPASPSDPTWVIAHLGMASALAALDWRDEALEEYRKVLPRAPRAALAVARLQLIQNLRRSAEQRDWPRFDKILDQAERAVRGEDAAEVAVLRAEALVVRFPDGVKRARVLLEAARQKSPRELRLWTALAGLAEHEGKPEVALALLRQAEQQLGDSAGLRLALARMTARRDTPGARAELSRLAQGAGRFKPANRDRLLRGLAAIWTQLGDKARARELWGRLADGRPDDLRVRLTLFDLALQAGDESALERLLGDIRRIEGPEGTLTDYGRACRLIRWGGKGDRAALARARALLGDLARRRPTWSLVPLALARADELDGDLASAVTNYLRAIDLGERSPTFIRRAAELLSARQRYFEADQVVRKLPASALDGDLLRLAAVVSLQSQNYERALTLAEQAVAAGSKDYRDHVWLGRVLAAVPSRRAEAERVLRRAVGLARDVPEAWVALVQHLARADRGKAEAALREAERALPRGKAPLALAQCCEAVGRLDRARQFYEAALAASPKDVALLRGVASFHLRTNQPEKAQPYLRRLMAHKDRAPEEAAWAQLTLALVLGTGGKLSPEQSRRALEMVEGVKHADTVEKQRARAVLLAARGTRAESLQAIAILEGMAAKQPLRADDQFVLAQLHDAVGDWPKAHERLRGLLAAHGDNPLYLAHYAARLLRRKELDQAGVWLAKLDKVEPKSLRTLEIKALLLREQGKAAEAATLVWEHMRGQKPAQQAGVLLRVAPLFETLGQTADAEKAYRQFAARSGRPEAALVLAEFLGRRKRSREALELCESAWGRCRPEAVAAATLTVLQAAGPDARRYERLASRLHEAAQANPRAAGLWLYLAVVRKLQGRYAEAETLLRKVIDSDNSQASVVALNNLAWLLALHNGRGTEAFEMISRAIDRAGPQPGLLDTRGVIYLSLGQPAPAVKDLEAAVADRASAPRYFHLARAHRLANNRAAALLALHKAKSLGLKANDIDPLERPSYDRLLGELTR